MKERIRFLAIAISEGDSFLVVDELPMECKYTAWRRNGYFDDFYLFDSAGSLWHLSRAVPIRPFGFFDKLFGRALTFALEFTPVNAGPHAPSSLHAGSTRQRRPRRFVRSVPEQ